MSELLVIDKIPDTANYYVKRPIPVRAIQIDRPFQVKTLEGTFTAKAGDYLIEGVRGELYSCEKSIFEETYMYYKKVGKRKISKNAKREFLLRHKDFVDKVFTHKSDEYFELVNLARKELGYSPRTVSTDIIMGLHNEWERIKMV